MCFSFFLITILMLPKLMYWIVETAYSHVIIFTHVSIKRKPTLTKTNRKVHLLWVEYKLRCILKMLSKYKETYSV